MKKISKIIYCDGSSLGNPGPGGFGVVALDQERKKVWEYGGSKNPTTNNQMELAACQFALKLILKSFEQSGTDSFELRLDSKYVIQGVTEWSKNWIKNNWKTAGKKKVSVHSFKQNR
jgi:ribonuclease HI